jgi:mono/diheme cytochrome c family protein
VIPQLKSISAGAALAFLLAALPAFAFALDKNTAAEQAGAVLFRGKGCAHCHGADLTGTQKGPSLAAIDKDKQWTPEKITNQILNGGQKMPPFADSVTDEEAAQLVAYLRAKHRTVPPPPAPGSLSLPDPPSR